MTQLLEIMDPDSTGTITYPRFVGVAALKLQHQRASQSPDALSAEVEQAFLLFTHGRKGGSITLSDLKRVAREIREESVSEDMLRNMILEANGGVGVSKGVGLEDFDGVMRRAGIFR